MRADIAHFSQSEIVVPCILSWGYPVSRPLDIRVFEMVRDEDVSGTSGVGVVGQVVEFADGTCVLRWLTEFKSTALYNSLTDLARIHGHDGRTRLVPRYELIDAHSGDTQ
jgi:hypothetical protein